MAKQKTKTRVKREVKKQIKKRPLLFALLAFFLGLGAAGGYFGGKYITRNDCFEVVGQQTIFLNVGQTYQEQGAKAVSFGKNITDEDIKYGLIYGRSVIAEFLC